VIEVRSHEVFLTLVCSIVFKLRNITLTSPHVNYTIESRKILRFPNNVATLAKGFKLYKVKFIASLLA